MRGNCSGLPMPSVPFFCSWPDAFGPCQFEYNTSDAFEFSCRPASLPETFRPEPAGVRAYLTGFPETALQNSKRLSRERGLSIAAPSTARWMICLRCRYAIQPHGLLYATLCEFQTQAVLPDAEDASAIIGIVGINGQFKIEARLNHAPLHEEAMVAMVGAADRSRRRVCPVTGVRLTGCRKRPPTLFSPRKNPQHTPESMPPVFFSSAASLGGLFEPPEDPSPTWCGGAARFSIFIEQSNGISHSGDMSPLTKIQSALAKPFMPAVFFLSGSRV